MRTKLVSGNVYTVYQLLADVEVPAVDSLGVAAVDENGGFSSPPSLGVVPGEHPWFGRRVAHHFPWLRVWPTREDAMLGRPHQGGCLPLRVVRPEFGGGVILDGPDWLCMGPPLDWSHDGRFHSSFGGAYQCPERKGV